MYEQKHKHKSGYAIVQVKKLRKWKENRWVMPFKSQSLFIHQQKHGEDYLTATVDPQKAFKYPRVLWIFGSENVVIIPIMYLDWRWSQVNLIVVELLHHLFNLFTSSSVEHPSASENRLKYWSLSGIVRHRPARKLQNDVEWYLSGVAFLRLVANSNQKRMQRRHFPVCVVSSEQ